MAYGCRTALLSRPDGSGEPSYSLCATRLGTALDAKTVRNTIPRNGASMLIFDAHLDLALNGVDWNRDLRQSVADIRAQETQLGMTELGRRTGTVTFPELHKAGVGLGVSTL